MVLETTRLKMREFREGDASLLFLLDSDPEVHKYLGNQPVTSLKDSEEVLQSILSQYKENNIGRCAIFSRETNDFIGWGGLKYETKVRDFDYFDLGYRLRKDYWGIGIGTEVAEASLNYGFNSMKLKEICAAARIENKASIRIFEKTGLKFIETFKYDDCQCVWYGIEKKNWELNQ